MRRVDGRKVTRLTLRGLSSCHRASRLARCGEGTTEVSRGHSSGLRPLVKGQTDATELTRSIRCLKEMQSKKAESLSTGLE